MNSEMLAVPPGPDGSLTLVFIGTAGQVVLQVDVSEGTASVDELFLGHLVMLTADVGVPAVVFVVRRADAQPTRVDRRLWRELSHRLADSSTVMQDLVVLGTAQYWSAVTRRIQPLPDQGSS